MGVGEEAHVPKTTSGETRANVFLDCNLSVRIGPQNSIFQFYTPLFLLTAFDAANE